MQRERQHGCPILAAAGVIVPAHVASEIVAAKARAAVKDKARGNRIVITNLLKKNYFPLEPAVAGNAIDV